MDTSVDILIVTLPQGVEDPASILAWLAKVGCRTQAAHYLERLTAK